LRHFVDVVKGEAEPSCGGIDGLRSILVLEAILESARTGRPVEVKQE
jgi:predicted dehydrogenase